MEFLAALTSCRRVPRSLRRSWRREAWGLPTRGASLFLCRTCRMEEATATSRMASEALSILRGWWVMPGAGGGQRAWAAQQGRSSPWAAVPDMGATWMDGRPDGWPAVSRARTLHRDYAALLSVGTCPHVGPVLLPNLGLTLELSAVCSPLVPSTRVSFVLLGCVQVRASEAPGGSRPRAAGLQQVETALTLRRGDMNSANSRVQPAPWFWTSYI